MANRCYYYVKDDIVKRNDIGISWDCGFSKEAKELYIERIISCVPDRYQICYDVTTASPHKVARSCSPYFLKCETENCTLEEMDKSHMTPVIYCYLYCHALNQEQREFISEAGSFTDVFHDPYKRGNNTQAYDAAVMQLLLKQGHEDYIDNPRKFFEWFIYQVDRGTNYAGR